MLSAACAVTLTPSIVQYFTKFKKGFIFQYVLVLNNSTQPKFICIDLHVNRVGLKQRYCFIRKESCAKKALNIVQVSQRYLDVYQNVLKGA